MASLTTRPHLHTTCLIVYVWSPRSWLGGPPSTHLWRIRWWLQWLKSFPPRMSVLREKLTIIQEAQVSAGFAAASNLQLLRRDALLRNFNFQPPVLSAVRTAPFEGQHVVGPEPKVLQARVRAIRQADCMTGSSVTFAKQKEVKTSTKTSSKKTAPRPSVFDRLGSPPSTTQRTVKQESPFQAGAGRARPRPFEGSEKSGKSFSSSAAKKRWRVPGGGSPGRLCPALAESAGQLPGHRHRRGRGGHCIPATTSAHPSKHQFPDQEQPTRPSASHRCLADEGSHRACHQREVPGFLQSIVSGTQEDGRSGTCDRPVHSQPPHGSSTLQDGDARVRPISHQKSGVDGVDRHTQCLSSCADASSCPQVSAFCGQQEGVPVHLSSVWTGNFSTGVHQAAETRRLAVEAARCEATRLLRRLADQGRYTGRSSTARPDNHQGPPVSRMDHQLREVQPHTKSRLPVHRDAVQHSTFHSGAPAENASKGPVSSSTLDGQSEHNCQRSAQTSRHAGVHGLAGSERTAPSSSSPMVGRYSMVPEDRELVRPDSSSAVGSVRGGMVVIPSSPARSTPRRQGDGSNSLHRCVQFGLGSPVRLTLDTGTVISISKIVPHKRSRDAGCHLCCERLSTSSEVPSGATDVWQRSDGGVHQEWGGTRSHILMQMTIRLLKWCDSKAITLVPVHLPGVHNIQADSLSRVDQTLTTEWTMAMESLRTVFAKWGEPQINMFATFANRRLVKFASPYPDPRVEWTDAMSMPWDKERGLLYAFPPFKMVPQVLQKIAQSPGVQVILIAQLQPAASWFPELMDLAQEDPVPLFVEGQDLLTQDVVHGRGRDRDLSLPAIKSSRVETLRAILRAKGHSREAANMMSRCLREFSQQVCESHWSRFMAFCRTKRWHVFRVRSHHFSTYMMHLFREGLLPLTIISHRTSVASVLRHWVYDPAADPHIKLLVRAFRLERPVQCKNHAQVGSSSGFIVINETTVYISKWGPWGILGWRHSPKMDAQMCVPVSIGFGETALVPARIEYSAWQMCVRERKHSTSTCGISTSGTWLPGEESATDAGPWMDHGTWDCSLESNGTGANVMSRSTAEALHPGLGKNPGGLAANVHSLEPQHQRYHEEPHKPMDRGDCQGSLHSSWSSVWPCDCAWGPSAFSFMGVQLSGGFTWHPVSGFLEVIWGLPELVPAHMACIAEGMSTLGPVVVAQHVVDPGHLHPPL